MPIRYETSLWAFLDTVNDKDGVPITAVNNGDGTYSLKVDVSNASLTIDTSTPLSVIIDSSSLPLSVTDYFHEVSMGNISGAKTVIITAHNPDIDSASAEDVWEGGGLLQYLTSAEMMDIDSTSDQDSGSGGINPAGTGAQLIKIDGLDNDYNEITENITLDGTNAVTTINSYLRVRSMTVLSGGSSPSNVGNIIATASTAGTIQCEMDADEGISKNIHYTIPVGKTAYILKAELNTSRTGGGQAPIVEFKGKIRPLGGMWVQVFDKKLDTDVTDEIDIIQPVQPALAEKTDVRIEVTTTNDNTEVFARFLIVVVDN